MRFGLISPLAVEVPVDQRLNSAISAHLKATCTQRAKLTFDVTVITALTGSWAEPRRDRSKKATKAKASDGSTH